MLCYFRALHYRNLGKTGLKLSSLSLGGALYGNVYGNFDKRSAIEGLHFGLNEGINYIDTAPWYGQGKSEKFLGMALEGIPRNKYYIGTKVGRYERSIPSMFDFTAEKTIQSAENSLRNLGLEYVDILQVHDVEFAPSVDIIVNETLPALEQLKQRGLCNCIGITGYILSSLKEVVEKSSITIDSVLSYGRLTLIDTSLIEDFNFFLSRNIGIINASPMSMGLLSSKFNVQEWHPSQKEIQMACAEAVKFCRNNNVDISRIAMRFSSNFEEVCKYEFLLWSVT